MFIPTFTCFYLCLFMLNIIYGYLGFFLFMFFLVFIVCVLGHSVSSFPCFPCLINFYFGNKEALDSKIKICYLKCVYV